MRTLIPLALAAVILPARTSAQPDRATPRVEHAPGPSLDATTTAELQTAIESIGVSGDAAAIPPLAARIRRGLPNDLLLVAIDTLGALAHPSAGDVLAELLNHRRAPVRERAVRALTACLPPGLERALLAALSDSDPTVRTAAAQGLAEAGSGQSIEALFAALDRGVLDGATAIGKLGGPPHVTRLLVYVGRVPFGAMMPAVGNILARVELPVRTRLEVIGKLQELATPEVKAFLEDFVASLPARTGPDAIRDAAEAAILRIVD